MSDFLKSLRQGQIQLGLCVMYPAPGIVERLGADWDWVWIDGQHGTLSYSDQLALVRACDLVGRPAFVRVPWLEAGHIGLALDLGAQGVIVPCIDTPEQARRAVEAAKFPPLGKRSWGARRPIDRHGRGYAEHANRDNLLVLQLETPEGLANAEAIAAIPGVDALFLGPDDIFLRRGFPMDAPKTRETLGPDMVTLIRACRNHGKIGVMVGRVSPDIFNYCVELGYTMIVAGSDVAFLAGGSQQALQESRAAIQKSQPPAPPPAAPNSIY